LDPKAVTGWLQQIVSEHKDKKLKGKTRYIAALKAAVAREEAGEDMEDHVTPYHWNGGAEECETS
jgi:hypothetical protein